MYTISQIPHRAAATLLALAAAAWGIPSAAIEPLELPPDLAAAVQPGPPKTLAQLRLLQEQVRRVVAAGRPVTVAVEMNDSVGSGVIISPDGLVLTAGHVCVEPNRAVWVRFPDNSRVKARSLGVNHRLDSGMVKITADPPPPADGGKPAWPFVPLAEGELNPGDWVVGLGQPNGFVTGRAPPVRLGRVLFAKKDTVNTDVTLVGGDSGGPLLNLRAEVVGIHSKIGEDITSNFHVPASVYRTAWELLTAGTLVGIPDGDDPDDWRPQIGFSFRERPEGVVVTQVFPGKAAAQAGAGVGDVLVEIDGVAISSVADVATAVSRQRPYDRIPVVVQRGGGVTVELEVWLGRASRDFPGSVLAKEGR